MVIATAGPASGPMAPSNSASSARPADSLILLTNPEIARIQTKDGSTVAQLSSGGRQLLMVFWRSLLCPFCREQMQDLSTKLASLRKLQTHVIMVYSASEEIAREFFQKYNFNGYEDFVHYINDPQCILYDAFGVGTGNFFQTWVPVAKHPTRGFVSPGTYFDAMKRSKVQGAIHVSKAEQAAYGEERMSAVFVLRNSTIVNEMREFHNHDLPDFLDLAIDPMRAGSSQTQIDYSRFYARLPTTVNRQDLQKFLAPDETADSSAIDLSDAPPSDSNSSPIATDSDEEDDDDEREASRGAKFFLCFPVAKSQPRPRVNSEDLTLAKVLENSKARAFFVLFAARECSIENVRFWEHVHVFKKKSANASEHEMRKRANDIYNKFFLDESPLLLNITQELKDMVRQRLHGIQGAMECTEDSCKIPLKDEVVEEIHAELFDKTLLEVMAVLSDTYMRFKMSDEFQNMLTRL